MENKEIVRILAIIGSIIGLIQAITGFWGSLISILLSLIGIIVAALALLSVLRPGDPIPYSAVFLIIFGVLMTLFSGWIGGVIVLVAGILWLVWKL